MPNLNLMVNDKRADGTGVIVCGNSDYTITWALDAEWLEYDTKTMRVCLADGTYIDTVFSGRVCPVPVLTVPGWVSIGLFAGNIRTSTPATLISVEAITTAAGTPADPPEDVYNQLMERLNSMGAGLTDENALQALMDTGVLIPVTDTSGTLLTDADGNILAG